MTRDSENQAKPLRNANDTRTRILAAARIFFSEHSYENVGTRDIAAAAGVDAALVNRYFGGKEKLFAEVIEGVFRLEDHLPNDLAHLGTHLVSHIMQAPAAEDEERFDALALLLRASTSPTTREMVSERFHAEFVLPLAGRLKGRDRETRAALIASYVIGLATMRHTINSPLLQGAERKAIATVGAAIQTCV
jgi:AcrR family transcriptional regulator